MSTEKSVVEAWLEAEETESPDCKVLAALKAATKTDKLEEHTALKNLHAICEEPEKDAAG